ncbi:hypothetical protein COW36_01665 [bacterium (Candidatus Blackallbacteria) CG17_big_fil_post_rev_8_21_14_2_50_48_46]|uniref:Uncharacterized protein n=1 Tax=bacterium (Candidatus Blackallbacteria) CG17_big_fil_post_rev_8_21_14_2_50_48_46 TaxID=2014261 RepID=A0A2M7GCA4_9BACT|nr:MAG: hypothetical protein COW64_09510 [bacterium (Candidatus Blackallbacteria) CG18_big_fil_WC_8_21_14_2_50_49_26]PIW19573.1 MAG: hypothetical protein COW36_01665 [bacterium (Candidatus Blackallbacteria) CG17_big_fil_post_rev_8_21_14_2_50_48_46]PIW48824.1 MAG: hypothetical protein COW20_06790 [bacterium (Candidatus Blackallbacteria) CG13_big_fil_rev_8_21_14_2_50_49_14]
MNINKQISAIFEDQGLNTQEKCGWVFIDSKFPCLRAWIENFPQQSEKTLLQLNIEISFGLQERIIQNFVGLGTDKESAIDDALNYFKRASLPVLNAAFWPHSVHQDTIKQETWPLAEKNWEVCIGDLSCRVFGEEEDLLPEGILPALKKGIQNLSLTGQRHWVNLLYTHNQDENIHFEVHLDNQFSPELKNDLGNIEWKKSDQFYSLKLFLILKNKGAEPEREIPKPSTDIETALLWFCKSTLFAYDWPDAEYIEELVLMGLEPNLAREIVYFTPSALARKIIEANNTQVSPYYLRLNADGEELERGLLKEHPVFQAAQTSFEYLSEDVIKLLTLKSSEIGALSQAALDGRNPRELELGPFVYFEEDPLEVGFLRAKTLLHTLMNSTDHNRAKKAWWKFW